jgi:hypothetical protein
MTGTLTRPTQPAIVPETWRLPDPDSLLASQENRAMPELLQTLVQLVIVLGQFMWELVTLLAPWALLIAWLAWWLWAVNWRRAWAVLAEGAWAPVVLLMILTARVWASLDPGECSFAGIMTLPSFWCKLSGVGLLLAVTLFCGWLQIVLGWPPKEISLETPPPVVPAHH